MKKPDDETRRELAAAYSIPLQAWDAVPATPIVRSDPPVPSPSSPTSRPSSRESTEALLVAIEADLAKPDIAPTARAKSTSVAAALLLQLGKMEALEAQTASAIEERIRAGGRVVLGRVIDALGPYPDALNAVLDVVRELGREGAGR